MKFDNFGDWAEVYDIIYDERYYNKKELEFYERLINETYNPTLEMACGTGRLYILYLEKGYDIHGSDISESMLNIVNQKCNEKNLDPKLY